MPLHEGPGLGQTIFQYRPERIMFSNLHADASLADLVCTVLIVSIRTSAETIAGCAACEFSVS